MYLDDNTEVTLDKEKAVAFSKFFRSIFTDHSSCSLPALATSPLTSNSTLENITLSPAGGSSSKIEVSKNQQVNRP